MSKISSQISEIGYWIEENVLSETECDELLNRLSRSSMKRGRAGIRHLMSHPAVAAITSDRRLLQIARCVLGDNAMPYRATLFEKSGHANWLVVWHQDTTLPLETTFDDPEWGPWSLKAGIHYAHGPTWVLDRILALRIHLDASTNDNGPLRLIPGSHAQGVMTDEDIFAYAATQNHIECLCGRGSVLAMRPLLVHSSSKAKSNAPRRVLHIEYADSFELAPGIRLDLA